MSENLPNYIENDYVGKILENKKAEEKAATDLAMQQQNTSLRNVQETMARNNSSYTPMQATMAPEVLNPQMQLMTGQGKQINPTITKAVVEGTKQAVNSNQEEYQTTARSALKEKLQDVSLMTSLGSNAAIFESYEQHKTTALAYAYDKGALAANEARGQQLCQDLNNINPIQRYNINYNIDSLKQQAGHIYTETLRSKDGKFHVTRDNHAGGYMEKSTGIDLSAKIGDKTAGEVLSEVGKFYEDDKRLTNAIEVLNGHAIAGNTTTASWETIVNGNFAALNDRFNFSERYNKMLDETRFAKGTEPYITDPHIRSFKGTKEEVDKLRNALDASGNKLFSDEELAALDECVTACGYGTDSAVHTSMLNSSMIARRKLAKNGLDELQYSGYSTLTNAAKVCGTAKFVKDTAGDFGRELLANSAEKKTNQLIASIANENTTAGKLEKAKKRLAKKKEKLGIDTNEELLSKMRQRRDVAQEIRDRRRDIRRATSGMDKTQARLVVNELRQQEMLLKKGKGSKRLNKRTEKLQKKLQRRQALRAAIKKHAPHLVGVTGKVKGSAPMRFLGTIHNKAAVAKANFQKALLKKLIIPIAGGSLIIMIACGAIAVIVGGFLMFIEFNGNTDAEGKEANDLQIVNEGMSEYESNQLTALKDNIEAVVKENYPRRWEVDGHPDAWFSGTIRVGKNKIKYNGKYYRILGRYDKPNGIEVPGGNYVLIDTDPSDDEAGEVYIDVSDGSASGGSKDGTVDVTPEYEVYDEFGDSASICNCMQLVSLYRYYYLFMDETGESDADNYWINDFKTGRMTTAWNDTHRVARNADGTDMGKWTDTLKYKALKDNIVGDLSGNVVYHSSLSTCDNAGTYSYLVPDGDGGYYTVTVACCMGHVKATANIEVDSKFETLIDKKRLKTADGTAITFDDDTLDTLTDYMGTYEDYYQDGYEMYADWEVYFGSAKNMFSEEEIADLLKKIEEENGPLNEQQVAVITTALSGCGKFSYSMGSHANCKKGVRGGATDCSGFVSWVHNNCGLYHNENICNTTTAWSLAPGHKTNSPSNLKPGDIVIKGGPGEASASEGNSNHVVIYLGKIKNEKTGAMEDWIAECGGSAGGSGAHAATKFKSYKTWVPLGSSDIW